MSIYFGKNRVSIKYNNTSKPGPTPVDPNDVYQNVIEKINFCKTTFTSEGEHGNYNGAWIALRDNCSDYEEFTLSNTGVVAVKTSDGHLYSVNETQNVVHIWDSSKDIQIEGLGEEKYRWVIYYYTSDTINSNSQDLDCMKTYNVVYVFDLDVKYVIASAPTTNAGGLFRSNDVIQGFDFINGHKCSASNSNKTSFLHFCNGCRSLIMIPDSVDVGEIQTFNYFCYDCVSLVKISDKLDFSNSLSFTYFCGNCCSLNYLPENMDTRKCTTFSNFCDNATALIRLPKTMDFSSATNMSTFCKSCYSLQQLPDEMDVRNVQNFNQFCSHCRSLKQLPKEFNTINGNSFNMFCYNCYSLKNLPRGINLEHASDFSGFMTNCYSLCSSDEVLDLRNGTNVSQAFEKCYALSNCKIMLPAKTFSIKYSSHMNIESLKFISDNITTTTSSCTLSLGSDNIARANKYDPTIISNLNAKGWTVN